MIFAELNLVCTSTTMTMLSLILLILARWAFETVCAEKNRGEEFRKKTGWLEKLDILLALLLSFLYIIFFIFRMLSLLFSTLGRRRRRDMWEAHNPSSSTWFLRSDRFMSRENCAAYQHHIWENERAWQLAAYGRDKNVHTKNTWERAFSHLHFLHRFFFHLISRKDT